MRVFVLGILGLHLFLFFSLTGRIKRGYPDFTVYYTAAKMFRVGLGGQLYNLRSQYQVQKNYVGSIPSRHGPLPYIHPPFEAIIFLPLTYLPYPEAFAVWDLLNICMLFGLGCVLRRSLSALRLIPLWEFVVACMAFFPVFVCFLQGQDSILLLLLGALGFNALENEDDLAAGCWFGLGMFKFQFILPLVVVLHIWRRRRAAAGFVTVSCLLVLASAALVGWHNVLHYPAVAVEIGNSPGLGGTAAEFVPNLRGLALGWPLHLPHAIGVAVGLLSSVALFLFAATKWGNRSKSGSFGLKFSLAIVVCGLVAWQTNMHDLSLLVLPLALTADYALCASTQKNGKRSWNAFALLAPALPLLISPLWMIPWLVKGKVSFMAIPLLGWVWSITHELKRNRESIAAPQISASI